MIRYAREDTPLKYGHLFAPAGGIEWKGQFYQGGERLPPGAGREPSELDQLRQAGAHEDPATAQKDFRDKPVPPTPWLKAGAVTYPWKTPEGNVVQRVRRDPVTGATTPPHPSVGTAERPYADDPVTSPSELAPFLLPEESRRISTGGRGYEKRVNRLLEAFNKLPPDLEYEEAALMGRAKRGWYKQAARSLVSLFGPDTPRFTALLAATSPQKSVAQNLETAASLWANWQSWLDRREKAGRGAPSWEEAEMWARGHAGLGSAVPGDKTALLEGEVPNILNALMGPTEPTIKRPAVLSGPKVESFRSNLLGNLQKVTNDVWMSYMGGILQDEFEGQDPGNPILHGRQDLAGPGYIAGSAKLRRVAQKLNLRLKPGETPWTPAEVQETVWSVFRALSHLGGQSRDQGTPLGPIQALNSLTHEKVHGNADFATLLLNNRIVRGYLSRAGYREALDRLAAQSGQAPTEEPPLSGRVVEDATTSLQGRARSAVARRAGRHIGSMMGPTVEYAKKRRKYADKDGYTPGPSGPELEGREGAGEDKSLTFSDAFMRAQSGNHKAFSDITKQVLTQIGLQGTAQTGVGDWEDGAEESVLTTIRQATDPETVKYLAAWYGLLGNQRSVLFFHPDPHGKDSVYTIQIPETDMEKVRARLSQSGVPVRTLVPGKRSTRVVIYDQNRSMRDQVARFAGIYNAPVRETIGSGGYMGGSTRTDARAKYRDTIATYESGHGTQDRPQSASSSGGPVHEGQPGRAPGDGGAPPRAKASKTGRKRRYGLRDWLRQLAGQATQPLAQAQGYPPKKPKFPERDEPFVDYSGWQKEDDPDRWEHYPSQGAVEAEISDQLGDDVVAAVRKALSGAGPGSPIWHATNNLGPDATAGGFSPDHWNMIGDYLDDQGHPLPNHKDMAYFGSWGKLLRHMANEARQHGHDMSGADAYEDARLRQWQQDLYGLDMDAGDDGGIDLADFDRPAPKPPARKVRDYGPVPPDDPMLTRNLPKKPAPRPVEPTGTGAAGTGQFRMTQSQQLAQQRAEDPRTPRAPEPGSKPTDSVESIRRQMIGRRGLSRKGTRIKLGKWEPPAYDAWGNRLPPSEPFALANEDEWSYTPSDKETSKHLPQEFKLRYGPILHAAATDPRLPPELRQVFELAGQGNPGALEHLNDAIEDAVGHGASYLGNLTDPEEAVEMGAQAALSANSAEHQRGIGNQRLVADHRRRRQLEDLQGLRTGDEPPRSWMQSIRDWLMRKAGPRQRPLGKSYAGLPSPGPDDPMLTRNLPKRRETVPEPTGSGSILTQPSRAPASYTAHRDAEEPFVPEPPRGNLSELRTEQRKRAYGKAPAGGAVVRGLYYPGGRFIPGGQSHIDKPTPYPQYDKLMSKVARYRRADGSYSPVTERC